MISDEQLVKKARDGDSEAFEELVSRYKNKVYSLSFRYMSNEEDAYDMAQEAFLKAFRSLRTFKGDASFSTWIYRITTNVCLDELRRRKRRIAPLSLNEPLATHEGDEVEKEIPDTSPTADILYEQKEFAGYIQHILDQIKPEHKTAIILRDMMDLTYEEISEVLNCSVGTVKSRLNRARTALRKKLSDRELLP
ncbi:RNA polymerase sigma factor RpoE [Candidatus Syntrophocurvum alkaliphilum]|uniref:RNA polymerase sigma factor RpoE n=1 Tax=Candidatus Syntrophocurvum alkaliphilum TaxID=2293317 RepID=A0A6I6DHA8_9FIRM|nr:sigma-70 family RNA polymerase sigma factor [Candidatus Syntrophocurvum alkaliphilum]QGU00183.1 RNA polymerase sigma factor RpoE [Candidatus Syntrophocurvum alkaliphilum]